MSFPQSKSFFFFTGPEILVSLFFLQMINFQIKAPFGKRGFLYIIPKNLLFSCLFSFVEVLLKALCGMFSSKNFNPTDVFKIFQTILFCLIIIFWCSSTEVFKAGSSTEVFHWKSKRVMYLVLKYWWPVLRFCKVCFCQKISF